MCCRGGWELGGDGPKHPSHPTQCSDCAYASRPCIPPLPFHHSQRQQRRNAAPSRGRRLTTRAAVEVKEKVEKVGLAQTASSEEKVGPTITRVPSQ